MTFAKQDPLAAIAHLRAVAARLEESEDPMLRRHAEAIRAYEQGAALGRTLDGELGLSRKGGAGPWWVQEARARRDDAIRQIWAEFYAPSHPPDAAADEIARLAERRKMSRSMPASDREALVDAALRAAVKFPGPQRLRALLVTTSESKMRTY